MPRSEDNRDDAMRGFAQAFSMSVNFIGTILMLAGLGWVGDYFWGTTPWLLLSGFGLGFVVGCYMLMRDAIKMGRQVSSGRSQNRTPDD